MINGKARSDAPGFFLSAIPMGCFTSGGASPILLTEFLPSVGKQRLGGLASSCFTLSEQSTNLDAHWFQSLGWLSRFLVSH